MHVLDTTGFYQYGLNANAVYVRVVGIPKNTAAARGGGDESVQVEVLPVQFGFSADKTGPEARAGEVFTASVSELIAVVPTLPYYEVTDLEYRQRAAVYGITAGVASGGQLLALGMPTGTVLSVRHYIDFYIAAKGSRSSECALVPLALLNPDDWAAQSGLSVAEIDARISSGRGMPPVFRLV